MSTAWKFHEENGIGILTFDKPDTEINVLSGQHLGEFRDQVTAIAARRDLKGLLITSAKPRIFIAGADINEINGIVTEKDAFEKAEQGKQIFQVLEDLNIPTVCVINGACLGGGYELALACSHRVASFSDNVKIGLPEVNLGILPGFGGSIRLPALVGLTRGLSLILAGKINSAKDALKNGMVDKLFPEKTLFEDALSFARALQGKKSRKPRKKDAMTAFFEDNFIGRGLVFRRARADVAKRTKGFYPAPFEVIHLIEKTYGKISRESYRLESEHFSRLGTTQVSKNLIKLFFMSERYKKLAWTGTKIKTAPVKKVGVIGAGVMGGGIAQLVSNRNIPVRVKDIQDKALGGALREAASIYKSGLKRGKVKKFEMERKMALISTGLTLQGFRTSDMVIEAVVEDLGIKQKVFKELGDLCGSQTVLASNTSSLSVTQMAAAARHPERVVGLHFFNPVHRMPLIEIIRAAQTSNETLERTVQFSRQLGKTVIVVKDAPGFLVNRLLLPYLNEAAYLMESGIPAEALDRIAEEFGMPMGPIELVDQVGIDVGYKVAHILQEAFGARMKVAAILETVKGQGLLGKKSGKGFYVYSGKDKKPNPEVRITASGPRVSQEDALKRMMYIMINEAARCLEEKVVDSPATVDIGMVMGTGFPPFRAGLLHYADSVGLVKVVEDLKRFSAEVSRDRFEPAPLLVDLAAKNKGFYTGL